MPIYFKHNGLFIGKELAPKNYSFRLILYINKMTMEQLIYLY